MKKIILLLILTISWNVFAAPDKNATSIEEQEISSQELTNFMPGVMSLGLGSTKGSNDFGWSRAMDFGISYFVFDPLGFGVNVHYDHFSEVQNTSHDVELNQVSLEILYKLLEQPFIKVGAFVARGRVNSLNGKLVLHQGNEVIYGALASAAYVVNDAFSVGPSIQYSHMNINDNLDNVLVKLELQYRFVLY